MESFDPGFWLPAMMAAVFVGLSKGGLPMIGGLAVPILSLVISPVVAAGLLLPVYIASDVFGLYAYRRAFDRRVLKILVPATTLGVGLGWATASIVSDRMVAAVVGVIGVSFALNYLLRTPPEGPPKDPRIAPGVFWGTIAGFTSFVSHAGAPPYQVYTLPLRMTKTMFAGTTTVLFAYVNAIKLVPYYALGQLSLSNLKIAAALMIPASLAVFAGVWLVKVLPHRIFFGVVIWSLLGISLKLIWDVITGG